jgi:hypothetical protein
MNGYATALSLEFKPQQVVSSVAGSSESEHNASSISAVRHASTEGGT